LEEVIEDTTLDGTVVYTDGWNGYNGLPRMRREHQTVDHSGPKCTWARDDDGDGVREVHCNTQEGIWTGVRNFLRRFRGVSKWYLAQYQAIFQWGYNIKRVSDGFLRILLGRVPSTGLAS
jgi:transposase